MPEYHQIETYATIKNDVRDNIATCKKFLQELGWLSSEIENWLNGFIWSVSDDGFVYANLSPKINIILLGESMDVQLMLLGWTSKIIESLPCSCLGFEILLETEKIDDLSRHPEIRYKENFRKTVWDVMKKASKFYPEYGVFFTDEVQDGRTWESFFDKDSEKIWQFECAIIPSQTKQHFNLPNDNFFSKETEKQLWLARKFVWDEPLWV